MLALATLVLALATPAPTAAPAPTGQRILGLIRATFRSHRPPPPYVSYTLVRAQNASNGYPDPVGSYTEHIWCRTSDRAALARRVYRDDARGDLTFERPAFNEARDPGPPTADVFEPAPAHPQPVEFVPTPEPLPTQLTVIGGVSRTFEFDYDVQSMDVEGDTIHLLVYPKRDPERNRIREVWADKKTYELRKLAATDKLFEERGPVYPVGFTITMGVLDGYPVVTDLHGTVGGGYSDDGKVVDFHFKDIAFPKTLPAWYFDAHSYAHHQADAPS